MNTYGIKPVVLKLRSVAVVTITALLTACFPNPDTDDGGHATFARESIPILLGRRPHGVDEVEAVADIAQLLGRDVAVEMMMKDDDFIDHWTHVIMDLLEVQRDPTGGISVAQDNDCWGAPTRPNPDPVIAEWVRDHGPKAAGAPTPAWNMTDLVRSAILIDDLSPIMRANLFTTSMRRAGGERRAELTNYLLRVYLNRDTSCLGCHNPEQSTSNLTDAMGEITWRRLWSIPGHPEKALFGNYLDGTGSYAAIQPIMRGDVRRPGDEVIGIRAWGMSDECSIDTMSDAASNSGALEFHGFQNVPAGGTDYSTAYFGSLKGSSNPKVSLWELEQALAGGVFNLKDGYERFEATSVNHPPGSDEDLYCGFVEALPNCTDCHGETGTAGLSLSGNDPAAEVINVDTGPTSVNSKRVVPNNPGASEVWLNITENMGSLPQNNRDRVLAWIDNGAPNPGDASICNTSTIPDVHPDEGFAFLTATNLVDGIWEKVMGYPLTIDHGFPRTKDQLHMLWNLTEYEFVPKDWSLKAVLTKVLSSDWYARRTPNLSQQGTAYELPNVLDPWHAPNPVTTPNPSAKERNDGQGELVDSYTPNNLLRNISDALGWREPRPFPGGGYPSPLDERLGQFLSPAKPGFQGVNFQSLLALESGVGSAGTCDKSGRMEDPSGEDWIDTAITAISTFNADNPDAPITLGEAWSMLKDRLVQDTTIERELPSGLKNLSGALTEEQAMIAFFREDNDPSLTLHSPSTALTDAQLEQKLRQGCNILVKSPEFMLTNITPRGYSDNNMPDPPRINVCLPGESCSYGQSCGKWRSVLSKMGHNTICEDRTIRIGTWFLLPGLYTDMTISNKFDKVLTLNPKFKPIFDPVGPEEAAGDAMRFDPAMEINTSNLPSKPQVQLQDKLPADSLVKPSIGQFEADLKALTHRKLKIPQNEKPEVAKPDVGTMQPRREIQVNLLTDLKVQNIDGKELVLKDIERVRQRLLTMCPDGMCGFVSRNLPKQCLAKIPGQGACSSLRTMCDPRCKDGLNCCQGRAPDASSEGMLSMWAEGAEVKAVEGVSILGIEDRAWRPLEKGTRLKAGDLLDVPLTASLAIQSGNVLFGDRGIRDAYGLPLTRHVISVTGPTSAKVLARPTKKGAMSPTAVAAGLRSERFLSKGVDAKQYRRLVELRVRPENRYTMSVDEIWKLNQDFEALHFNKESGLAPDGSDLIK